MLRSLPCDQWLLHHEENWWPTTKWKQGRAIEVLLRLCRNCLNRFIRKQACRLADCDPELACKYQFLKLRLDKKLVWAKKDPCIWGNLIWKDYDINQGWKFSWKLQYELFQKPIFIRKFEISRPNSLSVVSNRG